MESMGTGAACTKSMRVDSDVDRNYRLLLVWGNGECKIEVPEILWLATSVSSSRGLRASEECTLDYRAYSSALSYNLLVMSREVM
jgi:hypothetical protein